MTVLTLPGSSATPFTTTGVKTGWTVHFALMNKASYWVVKALDKTITSLPMGLKGIHSDTGSEFINKPVDIWCQRHEVHFSRGRALSTKTTIAMSNKRIMLLSAKSSGISVTRVRLWGGGVARRL
jgi:hypothetical protein